MQSVPCSQQRTSQCLGLLWRKKNLGFDENISSSRCERKNSNYFEFLLSFFCHRFLLSAVDSNLSAAIV